MSQPSASTTIEAVTGKPVNLPSGEFVANAAFEREGLDLHLTSPDGQTVIVENYFGQSPQPDIVTPDGARLSPEMVDAFVPPEHVGQYAENLAPQTMSDLSPAGKITEVVGEATIVRADGTKVAATVGTPVYPGDVVQTTAKGAVNILFADNTTFAISENARMSVDEFTYSAADQSGHSFFSMLQGVFVYTSGLIGKNDPGNVNIETPVGSIGIRGTVVAGDIKPAGEESKITIVDGAIVLSNSTGTLELNNAFQTASVNGYNSPLSDIGRIDSSTFSTTYQAVSDVAAPTFDALPNTAPGDKGHEGNTPTPGQNAAPDAPQNAPAENGEKKSDATTPDGASDATQQAATAGTTTDVKTEAPVTSDTVQPAATVAATPASTTTFTTTGTTSFGGTGDFSATSSTTDAASTFSGTTAATTGLITPTVVAPIPVATDVKSADGTTTGATTGSTTGGVYVPPPPPPAGVPDVHFNFMPIYTKGTAVTTDDGVPLFGGVTDFTLTPTPILIGQVVASNLPNGSTIEVAGFDANGDIVGSTLTINTGFNYNITAESTIFHYDASTGNLYLTDPLGISGVGMSNFSFSIVAKNALGQTIATNSTIIQFDVPPTVAGSNILLGNNSDQLTGLTGTTGSDLIFGFGGNDMISGGLGGADTLLGGLGNDTLWVATPGFNFVGGGVGEDALVIGHPAFAKQIFDFTPANNVNNIEKILIKNSATNNGNDIHLNIRDVFEMTDADHTLLIDRSGTGGGSVVNIDNSDTTLADFVQTAGTVGSGEIVYSGVFNGSTVTLVINQGTSPSTDGIAVNVMP